MVEGEIIAGAAILAGKAVPQENIETREGGLPQRTHIALERNDAGQLHFHTGAVHRAVVKCDDIDALEEHGFDRVLPGPDGKWIVAQRTKIRIEYEGRPGTGRHSYRQKTTPKPVHAAFGLSDGETEVNVYCSDSMMAL